MKIDGIGYYSKHVGLFVIEAQAGIRPNPDSSLSILGKAIQKIVDEAPRIGVVVLKCFERIAVIPVQAVGGSKPEKPLGVLKYCPDRTL